MAFPLTWFLANAQVNSWQQLDEAAQAAATTCGWIVSTGTTNRSKFASGTGATSERAATTFDATTYPNGTLDNATLFDAWRTTNKYQGSFASANWVVTGAVRAVTNNGGTETGILYCRLFRSVNTDGSSAVEITSAIQTGTTSGALQTASDVTSVITFNPGAFAVAGEYLFLQIAWGRVGAGGMTSSDVHFRTGQSATVGTRVVTSDFSLSINVSDSSAITERVAIPMLLFAVESSAMTDSHTVFIPAAPFNTPSDLNDTSAPTESQAITFIWTLQTFSEAPTATETQAITFTWTLPALSETSVVDESQAITFLWTLQPFSDDALVDEFSNVVLVEGAFSGLTVDVNDVPTADESNTVLLTRLVPDVNDATVPDDAVVVYWSITPQANDASVLDDAVELFVHCLFIFDAADAPTTDEFDRIAMPEPPATIDTGDDAPATDDLATMLLLNFALEDTILMDDAPTLNFTQPPLGVNAFESLTATGGKVDALTAIT